MVCLPEMTATVPAYYEDTYLSESICELCVEIGEDYNICPELIMSIIEHESSGRSDARNGNCVGLMQVNEIYHGAGADLTDPETNIEIGTAYLAELFEESQDVGLVLMRYNGVSKAYEYSEQGIITDYAANVLERSEELEHARGK